MRSIPSHTVLAIHFVVAVVALHCSSEGFFSQVWSHVAIGGRSGISEGGTPHLLHPTLLQQSVVVISASQGHFSVFLFRFPDSLGLVSIPYIAMADYSRLPANATLKPELFKLHIDDQKLQDMKQLIKLSPLGPETYENLQESPDRRFGISLKWMEKAKEYWQNTFDWFVSDHANC